MSTSIKVLLVDDHAMIREMLEDRLKRHPDIEVMGAANDAEEAVGLAIKGCPHIVLMDIDMPGLHCFDAAKTIQAQCDNTRIIFLSAFSHDRYIEQALAVEAAGYLTKSAPSESLIAAIQAVADGGSYYSPEIQARIVVEDSGTRLANAGRSRTSLLTPRELEVLRYIARGLSQKEIAAIMHLSAKTVHCHSGNLMKKLDIHDRVDLARFAIREGLAEA